MQGSTFYPNGATLPRIMSNPKGKKHVPNSQILSFVSVQLFNSVYAVDF